MKAVLRMGAALGLAAILLAGCGGPGVDTGSVKGKVTVAGQPVKGILVNFTPEAGGRPATGVTDEAGNFTLSTFSSGDGAIPGKHKVSFSFATSGEPPPSDAPATEAPPPPFNTKYANGETSGITADVAAGKTNQLEPWDLEK